MPTHRALMHARAAALACPVVPRLSRRKRAVRDKVPPGPASVTGHGDWAVPLLVVIQLPARHALAAQGRFSCQPLWSEQLEA